MVMATQARVWTTGEVRELMARALREKERLGGQPWRRYELIDGELLVTPSPTGPHQHLVGLLLGALLPYVDRRTLGVAMTSPADLVLGPPSIVQPDIFVVPASLARPPISLERVTSLLLAVEILSPSSARHDRGTKRRQYQRAGVPEYWIVDPDARLVERWRPDDERPEIATGLLTWQPAARHAPLSIDLRALFAQALGDEASTGE